MGIFSSWFKKTKTPPVEPADAYQKIGTLILAAYPVPPKKAMLYAEVEEDSYSLALFFQESNSEALQFRFPSTSLNDVVYEFWEAGDGVVAPKSWGAVIYLIENGSFKTDFVYPDQIDENEDAVARRARVLEKYFPGAVVNYKNPE